MLCYKINKYSSLLRFFVVLVSRENNPKGSKEYDKLLSAKATLDLDSFDVPVYLTIKGKDLLKSQDLSASVKAAVTDSVKVSFGGGYNIKSEKISTSVGIEYSAEKFTASVDVSFSIKRETKTLAPTVVVSSDELINGTTFELSWKLNTDGTNATTILLDKDDDYVNSTQQLSLVSTSILQ